MKKIYKIKNAYVTAIVVDKEFELSPASEYYILSDGTSIPAHVFDKLYREVNNDIGEPLGPVNNRESLF